MSEALPGEHYCEQHQGNHSHYAEENCTVCKLSARVAEMEAKLEAVDRKLADYMATSDPVAVSYAVQIHRVIATAGDK